MLYFGRFARRPKGRGVYNRGADYLATSGPEVVSSRGFLFLFFYLFSCGLLFVSHNLACLYGREFKREYYTLGAGGVGGGWDLHIISFDLLFFVRPRKKVSYYLTTSGPEVVQRVVQDFRPRKEGEEDDSQA